MKDFIDVVSEKLSIKSRDLFEIDLYLSRILFEFAENSDLSRNLLLKGGTCLIKTYFNYYRFSVDLDFTWKNQEIFMNKSGKKIRAITSDKITEISQIIWKISQKIGLDFEADKNNRKFINYGGNGKLITFRLYYTSCVSNLETYIKIQINFVELLKFESHPRKIKHLIPKDKELQKLFPKSYEIYSKNCIFNCYSYKEILCEKVRALYTRSGLSSKDFLDIFLITANYDIEIENLTTEIIEKIQFSLKQFKKYRINLEKKREMILSNERLFNLADIEKYSIKEIDRKRLESFLKEFQVFLSNMINEIL